MSELSLLGWLFGWSGLATALAWWLPVRLQPWGMLACGVGLLASVSTTSLALLAAGTLLTFQLHRHAAGNKVATALGIAAIVGGFAVSMASGEHIGSGIGTVNLLPIGLAFYSLRLVHYLVESYKGNLRPHGLGDVLCYHFLPSALPAGPIHRFDEFLRDLRRRRWDPLQFSGGLQRILHGLAKVVVLGNYLVGQKLDIALAGSMAQPGFEGAYATALLFWLKLYVLFSGYSDIAIGFAALMGFRLRENFRWPFFARNIGEFWQRWHLSLSSWCRDYVFSPALSLTRSHALAVLAAMIVLGLWHEFSLRYLLWGGYHGLGMAAHRVFADRVGPSIARMPMPLQRLWGIVAVVLTLHFVMFSFDVTRLLERSLLGS